MVKCEMCGNFMLSAEQHDFMCSSCSDAFIEERPIKTSSRKKKFKCAKCKRNFKTARGLKFHIHSCLRGNRNVSSKLVANFELDKQVVQAKLSCPEASSSERPAGNHSPEKTFLCMGCKRNFKTERGLNVHRNSCVSSSENLPSETVSNLELCKSVVQLELYSPEVSSSDRQVRSHNPEVSSRDRPVRTHNPEVLPSDRPVRSINPEVSSSDRPVRTQIPEKLFKCAKCKRNFETLRGLGVHKHICLSHKKNDAVVDRKPKHLECELCGRRYHTFALLSYHCKISHGEQKLSSFIPWRYTPVRLSISTEASDVNHVQDVGSNTLYPCSVCQKGFSSVKLMRKCEKGHISGSYIELRRCLKMVVKDGEKMKSREGLPTYKCPMCGFEVNSTELLESHFFETHLNSKLYICTKCKVTFTDEDVYEKHKKSHKLVGTDVQGLTCERSKSNAKAGIKHCKNSGPGQKVASSVKLSQRVSSSYDSSSTLSPCKSLGSGQSVASSVKMRHRATSSADSSSNLSPCKSLESGQSVANSVKMRHRATSSAKSPVKLRLRASSSADSNSNLLPCKNARPDQAVACTVKPRHRASSSADSNSDLSRCKSARPGQAVASPVKLRHKALSSADSSSGFLHCDLCSLDFTSCSQIKQHILLNHSLSLTSSDKSYERKSHSKAGKRKVLRKSSRKCPKSKNTVPESGDDIDDLKTDARINSDLLQKSAKKYTKQKNMVSESTDDMDDPLRNAILSSESSKTFSKKCIKQKNIAPRSNDQLDIAGPVPVVPTAVNSNSPQSPSVSTPSLDRIGAVESPLSKFPPELRVKSNLTVFPTVQHLTLSTYSLTPESLNIPAPDFDSEEYILWLKSFVSKCNLAKDPLPLEMARTLSQISSDIFQALLTPEGSLQKKENNFFLLKFYETVNNIMTSHARHVLTS